MSAIPNNHEVLPIRVLLVEDSLLQLRIIRSVLDADPHTEVVGTAVNGAEALKVLALLKPDVICTDYHMPVMDGLEFIEKAIKLYPCPILVLSISVQPDQVENIFKLLSAGAIDVMAKPKMNGGLIGNEDGKKLVERIRILNGVRYIRKPSKNTASHVGTFRKFGGTRVPKIIVMGASTGGPQALEVLLPRLNRYFSIPIVCIQHISHGFLNGMMTWLESLTSLLIETGKEGEFPLPGHLYFPPEGFHLTFAKNGSFLLTPPEVSDTYCPSIDLLFRSAANVFESAVLGVLLSGMGRDGASGMKSIYDGGGDTIVQDEASSIVFGMPAVALNAGVVCHVRPPKEIAQYFNALV